MIKLIVVDDIEIIRESLKFVLSQDKEIEVIGCASNGKEALDICSKKQPDIVLMDIAVPVCDGIEGTKLIKSLNKNIKILILTTIKDDINIAAAIKHGASGYILKDLSPSELISSIKSVANGFKIMHDSVFDILADSISINKNIDSDSPDMKLLNILNQRELDIIKYTVDGKSYAEISASLFISEGRVRNIVSEILKKLKLRDRLQLAVFAVKNKLI